MKFQAIFKSNSNAKIFLLLASVIVAGFAQSQAYALNCKLPDPNILNAVQEVQQRAEGGSAATAYCAAANMGWIVAWQAQQCLMKDSSLTSVELEQTRLHLESAREAGRSNAEGYATLTDGHVCKCWTRYCLK